MQVALVYCDMVDLEIEDEEMRKLDPRATTWNFLLFLPGRRLSEVNACLFNIDLVKIPGSGEKCWPIQMSRNTARIQ